MTEHTIDEIFIEGSMKRLDGNVHELNTSNKQIKDEYELYTSYDYEIRMLFEKIKSYLSLRVA